ncbi:TetR/AcrR family transcriptional regulator [Paraburkholderia caballeronis]|uniref:DNA-binding transcriptional regulator, AcrR family n=1 Tax=Paraburkholderia caballeronis TaxID=416943 RepID=A0A1H7EYW8_9BURK|nr:TetR/AcrR family transcriptional regulator [Paraburkholderia caballeronis]PXW23858.1 TetR family transcriptional regulator [Paraburkholderia caballeronis]PXW99622.1 TetR family transcriptional regulator [Paraburkholderia caballeronis]RAJ96576.1 TetR family transcriptional regulator [Paraburkholderia caballeronis]SEE80148.1 transcriptional regulator, TetR family [Paraburkholderia caballeronis]SEK18794.1 DNA-binding transcriptional regulator, AcrR family [Paraburkholderia caballeronis]
MVRPREFDRDEVLDRAMRVFWEKGYAATSTDDLLAAMNIGRQSLYNAFGDKRRLYLEALERYQANSTSGHLGRLNGAASPLAGIEALLLGLIHDDDADRALGCMGVNAVCEFGTTDPELPPLRAKVGPTLAKSLAARIRDGQARGEIDATVNANEAAAFVQLTMQGIQLAARAGTEPKALKAMARFAVGRLKRR